VYVTFLALAEKQSSTHFRPNPTRHPFFYLHYLLDRLTTRRSKPPLYILPIRSWGLPTHAEPDEHGAIAITHDAESDVPERFYFPADRDDEPLNVSTALVLARAEGGRNAYERVGMVEVTFPPWLPWGREGKKEQDVVIS
jgi:hypothetical protein